MKISGSRLFVYIVTLVIIAGTYLFCYVSYPSNDLINQRLTQIYGFTSLFYLLGALYISPVYKIFKSVPGKAQAILARRAIGVSAFVLAILHSSISFFTILGGITGLPYLTDGFEYSLIVGLLALVIMSALAITSFDLVIKKMGHYWQMLHNLVYSSVILIILHATMIGSHFQDFSSSLAILFYLLTYIWIGLEAVRIDIGINQKVGVRQSIFGICSGIFVVISIFGIIFYSQNRSSVNSLSVHSTHISGVNSELLNNINPVIKASLGNTGINFHSILDSDTQLEPNKQLNLSFKIKNDTEQNQVSDADAVLQNRINLTIINYSLDKFDTVFGTKQNGEFTFPYTFESDGIYHLLLVYQPKLATEQFFDYTISVGKAQKSNNLNLELSQKTDESLKFDTKGELSTSSLNAGKTDFIFDAGSESEIKTIAMINAQTGQFVHLFKNSDLNSKSGRFTPYALKNQITGGIYKIFVSADQNGQTTKHILTIKVN